MAVLSFPGGTGDGESENKARKYRLFRLGCIFFRNRFEYVLMYSGTDKQPLKMYFLMPMMA